MDWPFPLYSYSYSKISNNTGVNSNVYGTIVAKKSVYFSLSPYISLWRAEPLLPCSCCNNVVITPNSWHRRVLLNIPSPLKPPFSLFSSAKCLIVRDRHDKRLRVFTVLMRLFFTIFVGVLTFSTFSVKMAVFCISEKYSFDNQNFENWNF